jgi:hypothetical protein
MARKTEWFHRLPEIRAQLEQLPSSLLDRAAIELLFQIRPRQATRILHRMGATLHGGALLIDRETLIHRLQAIEQDANLVFEQGRRKRFEEQIEEARRQMRSRRIIISTEAAPANLEIQTLPEDIHLEPGRLEVRFRTPTELLQKLLLLAQTISEDWISFESGFGNRTSVPNTIGEGNSK